MADPSQAAKTAEVPEFADFAAFWPYYLAEHSNATNRRLHFVGTTLALFAFASLIRFGNLVFVPLMLVGGYGFAWIGHFIVEKNRPATFQHPFWSLLGDFRMYGQMLTGKLWR